MYLSREKFDEIKKKHSTVIVVPDDAAAALEFAYDLMIAEIDAVKAKEPHATASIDRMEQSAYDLYEMFHEVENEVFSEGG